MTPTEGVGVWHFQRDDWKPVLWILLLPLVMAAHQLLGYVKADPLVYMGGMSHGLAEGILRGVPFIDPNNGYTTQALGRRAALEWLHGNVPWWNYFSGVGLPLAAEYQPGAFFPLTFLLLLPSGTVLLQAALHSLSGIGTYGLLRQLGVGRASAAAGGLLYAFNGTLAWHAHAPATAVPFLPWMLWGIERVHVSLRAGLPAQWRLLAAAMALGLLAAFPETSFLSGLLALAWAVVRGVQLGSERRVRYAAAIAAGGFAGIAIAAPQIHSFFHFLLYAHLGGHGADFARAAFPWHAMAPSLIAPYIFGPIFAYSKGNVLLETIWGGIGGFVTVSLVCVATYGFWSRRDAIGWLLIAWIAVALGRTFGLEPLITLWNLIPGVSYTAFVRYAPPSWELAFVILAARGLEDLACRRSQRGAIAAAAGVGVLAITTCVAAMMVLWPQISIVRGLRNSALFGLLWATITVAFAVWFCQSRKARALSALLVAEAVFMTFVPTLSAPRAGYPDIPAIHFLRDNLGLQRFYTLGPIEANYGAYFGVASINHNYLPVSSRWVEWVRRNLDSNADPIVFNGKHPRPEGTPSQTHELRRNLDAYQWVGVKFVVVQGDDEPLAGVAGVRKVYADGLISIFELPAPRPYFESSAGHCKLQLTNRGEATAECSQPDTLVRRELFFPGWKATVGSKPVVIAEHGELFQSVEVPAGRSNIRFSYAPPYVGWAWLASALGLILAFAPLLLTRARRWAPRSRSAT